MVTIAVIVIEIVMMIDIATMMEIGREITGTKIEVIDLLSALVIELKLDFIIEVSISQELLPMFVAMVLMILITIMVNKILESILKISN